MLNTSVYAVGTINISGAGSQCVDCKRIDDIQDMILNLEKVKDIGSLMKLLTK